MSRGTAVKEEKIWIWRQEIGKWWKYDYWCRISWRQVFASLACEMSGPFPLWPGFLPCSSWGRLECPNFVNIAGCRMNYSDRISLLNYVRVTIITYSDSDIFGSVLLKGECLGVTEGHESWNPNRCDLSSWYIYNITVCIKLEDATVVGVLNSDWIYCWGDAMQKYFNQNSFLCLAS